MSQPPPATPDDVDPLKALQRLWLEVADRNSFYRSRWTQAGLHRSPESIAEFVQRVPWTTKAEIAADQAAHPPYGTNLTYPLEQYTRCHQTSGTHGAPLRWLDTPESWNAMTEDWMEVFKAAGVGPGDRILFAFSFGPFLGFWLAFEAGQRLGALCLAGGGMSSTTRLRVLREHACTVLCCTPTYALHLAEVAAREGVSSDAIPLRTLIVAGEPGGSQPAVRTRLQQAWNGARVFDHHGMTETGPVTHEHPDHPGTLVVLERSFFAEVIEHTTGAPVPEGTPGELVLTTLRRFGSPLVRYRTGDIVCARRLDGKLCLPGGIQGRRDDMVIVRGVNVYPTAVDELVRHYPEIAEYRVTLDTSASLPELSLEVEGTEPAAQSLADHLHEALALRIPVTAVPAGTLPRFEHKARRWRRLN